MNFNNDELITIRNINQVGYCHAMDYIIYPVGNTQFTRSLADINIVIGSSDTGSTEGSQIQVGEKLER